MPSAEVATKGNQTFRKDNEICARIYIQGATVVADLGSVDFDFQQSALLGQMEVWHEWLYKMIKHSKSKSTEPRGGPADAPCTVY